MESKTLSWLLNGHGCCVSGNILVPDSILVPEIVNSGCHAQAASNSYEPHCSWV